MVSKITDWFNPVKDYYVVVILHIEKGDLLPIALTIRTDGLNEGSPLLGHDDK